jgi:hypothetical protein
MSENHIDFNAIRRAHPLAGYCEQHGIRLHRSGNRLIGKCPIHNERNGNAFVVHSDGKWQCYGKCDKSGDVIDLERELHGGSIREAAARLGAIRTTTPIQRTVQRDDTPKPTAENPLALRYILSDEELATCHRFTLNLLNNEALMRDMASYRGWRCETIRGLALEGYIGRDDEDHTVLISEAGCRSRINLVGGKKTFNAHFGKSWLWRGALILSAEVVYITEGESDTIRLIDTGIENDGKTVVVGMQGATFNLAPWAFLFAGKRVIIATDYDTAGERAAARLARVLSDVATVQRLDLRRAA